MKILSRHTLAVIFESTKETMKETVNDANVNGISLKDANLNGADLSGIDLSGADLRNADLTNVDFSSSYLNSANLSGAELDGAKLNNVSLVDVIGNKKELRTLQLDTYSIAFTEYVLQIGCEKHTIEEWENFGNETINKMDSNALEFWSKWKKFIFKAIELSFK